MTTFDPNKLDIDFDKLDQQAVGDTPKEPQLPDPLDQVSKVKESSIPKTAKKQEAAEPVETQAEKKPSTQTPWSETAQSPEPETVYDINLASIEDIMSLLIANKYSFVTLEPSPHNYVEVIFRDEGTPVMTKRISYPVYTQILLKMKAMSKLVLENTTDVQNGTGELKYKNTWYKITTKTSPDPLGEKIFFKASPVAKKIAAQKQQAASFKTMLKFMWVVAFLFLVLWGAFLTFVVLNAKTVDDVNFFLSLGINPNNINIFIQKIVTGLFMVLVFLETIFACIYGFKFLVTKKSEKRKKIVSAILASVFLVITFATASTWLVIDKKIKELPNWWDVARGSVQIYDSSILTSTRFDVDDALLSSSDLSNLIGPINIRFDLSVLADNEARRGFTIEKYIWDFKGWADNQESLLETSQPVVFYDFDTVRTYDVTLTLQGVDSVGKQLTKTQSIPAIEITDLIEIDEQILDSGWKMLRFNGESLKQKGTLEWYYGDDFQQPVSKGYIFQPGKPIFDETIIALSVKNSLGITKQAFDRVFVIQPDAGDDISWTIVPEVDLENDMLYSFRVEDIENDFWDGIIESFVWEIDGKQFTRQGSISSPSQSSEVSYEFVKFGDHDIQVTLTDSLGQSTTLSYVLTIDKKLFLSTPLEIFNQQAPIENMSYQTQQGEYIIDELGIPTTLTLSARKIKTQDPLYSLQSVAWDLNNDGDIDTKWDYIDHDILLAGDTIITAYYTFIHRKNNITIETSERLYIQAIKKDVILELDIEKDTQYVPVTVRFDASRSRVLGQDIVKFEYDYGDGIIEDRDAINPGHIYRTPGDYDIVLTVTTDRWEKYSISKKLILTNKPDVVKITPSLYSAPVYQEIDFSSHESSGQIVSYYWDFWDGNTSNQANPSHSYSTPGDYKVSLLIEFSNNNTKTDEIDMSVTP